MKVAVTAVNTGIELSYMGGQLNPRGRLHGGICAQHSHIKWAGGEKFATE